MMPKLTTDHFFYASLVFGLILITIFFIRRGKSLCSGDVVPILIIFISSFGFIYPIQIWYLILDKQDMGVLEDQKISILAGSIATMWVAALAGIQSFKK